MTLLAALPVLMVLVLMLGLRWPAARAGVVAAVATVVLAVTAFDFGRDAGDPFGVTEGLIGVVAEAGFIALTIIAIIGPALGIHHLQSATGATPMLDSALRRLTPDPRAAALLIAWFFALFMEGAAGFGTSVALAAPFLVAAGFAPVTAVVAAMLGHVVGVSFGAIGTPVAAQAAISGLSGSELAGPTAIYHAAIGWVLALVVVRLVSGPDGPVPWRLGLAAGVAFLVPYAVVAQLVGPELPTLAGAVLGTAGFVVVANRWSPATPDEPAPERAGDEGRRVAVAAAPYLVLIVAVLLTRLVGPVEDALRGVVVDWELFGAFSGSVEPLYHPGLLLTVAFLLGAVVQRASTGQVAGAIADATRQLVAVTVALVSMVTIARLMSQAGMTADLADAAAQAGSAWPLISPVVGALGTFVTGSATASNVLFTELQVDTATARELAVPTMLGAQGFGAAAGNAIAPHNIVAAAATVGLGGRESEILRRTLPVTLAYLALGGAVAFVLTR
ncbi:MAG TPA: L-lactate permease [Acidimicrobiales bacterium]|nr:L-lactate permease [Acidimicrobiales bacterium]